MINSVNSINPKMYNNSFSAHTRVLLPAPVNGGWSTLVESDQIMTDTKIEGKLGSIDQILESKGHYDIARYAGEIHYKKYDTELGGIVQGFIGLTQRGMEITQILPLENNAGYNIAVTQLYDDEFQKKGKHSALKDQYEALKANVAN